MLDRLASPSVSGQLILQQVIDKLKLPGKAVHQLVTAKLLANPIRRAAWMFDADSIARFQETFTYDVSLAREKGVPAADIRETLASLGISPMVVVDTRRRSRAAIYRIEDLPDALANGRRAR